MNVKDYQQTYYQKRDTQPCEGVFSDWLKGYHHKNEIDKHELSIYRRVLGHLKEVKTYFSEDQIVGIFLQGSQNYGLDIPSSDVDTKLIITPPFKEIAMNQKPVSTTHIRENNEHIDFKDIRLYIQIFHKQNLNFLEILFTPFVFLNPLYAKEWLRLYEAREEIAHMNPYRAVHSMRGIALEKYHAMERRYPSKIEIIDKYGYDGKQVSHLIRIYDYLLRYIAGEKYESCLIPSPHLRDKILAYKLQEIPLETARNEAKEYLEHIEQAVNNFSAKPGEDPAIRALLNNVTYEIMRTSVKTELLTNNEAVGQNKFITSS